MARIASVARWMALAALALPAFLATVAGQEADLRTPLPVPEHFRITLEVDRPTFLLGELVLVHYGVENTGDRAFQVEFGGDDRCSGRAQRFVVTAEDQDGRLVPDPHPSLMSFGGMLDRATVEPNRRYTASLGLHAYRRIERAGTYTIRVCHDLGWDPSADPKRRSAEVKIAVAVPTPEEAEEVMDRMLALPRDDCARWGERREPYRDLTALAYLPYLPRLAPVAHQGDREALAAIGMIPAAEATRCLIGFLGREDPEMVLGAVLSLMDRLPDPGVPNPHEQPEDAQARRAMARAAWRPELAPALRAAARRLLAAPEPVGQERGAEILAAIGVPEDAPDLMKALDASVEAHQAYARAPHRDGNPQPPPDHPALPRALESLLMRGLRPPADPQTPAEIATYLLALRAQPDARPAGWAARAVRWLEHPVPPLRQLVLEVMPNPCPAEIVQALPARFRDADESVQHAAFELVAAAGIRELKEPVLARLAETAHSGVCFSALSAATAVGARYEGMTILAGKLGEADAGCALGALIDATLHNEEWESGPTRDPDPEVHAGLAARWLAFLRDHEARVRAGEIFRPDDPALDPKLFDGLTYILPDGRTWPK